MKYVKILGLLAIAATALMVFAGTVSATILYSGATQLTTGSTVHSTLKSKTKLIIAYTDGFIQNSCSKSTLGGKTTNETGMTVTVAIETLTFEECTRPTKTITPGKLHFSWTNGHNGTLMGSESEVTMEASFGGGQCIYGTGEGTHLGTLTGSTTGSATLVINAVIPLIETESGFCASHTWWKAEYVFSSPANFNVGS